MAKMSDFSRAKLADAGVDRDVIAAIDKLLAVSDAFYTAKGYADTFDKSVNSHGEAGAKTIMFNILGGLLGWQGDTAAENKHIVRLWLKHKPVA
ncbi:hypothetical protein JXVLWARM_CDS_0091 [Burkholderia phage Bm1]